MKKMGIILSCILLIGAFSMPAFAVKKQSLKLNASSKTKKGKLGEKELVECKSEDATQPLDKPKHISKEGKEKAKEDSQKVH